MLITFYHAAAKHLTSEERLFTINAVSSRLRSRSIEVFEASSTENWVVRDDSLQIDLEPFMTGTAARWKQYSAARDLVTSSPEILSGTPVIKDTRIPVYDVAASAAAGHSVERIMSAYPHLTAEHIELATLYAKANPQQGRPRPAPMLKRDNLISEDVIRVGDSVDESLHRRVLERQAHGHGDRTGTLGVPRVRSRRGLLGIKDLDLMPVLIAGNFTLVTKNSIDFRGAANDPGSKGLFKHQRLHAGSFA